MRIFTKNLLFHLGKILTLYNPLCDSVDLNTELPDPQTEVLLILSDNTRDD